MKTRIALCALTALIAAAPSLRAEGKPASGKSLYELRCAVCHGKDGAGNPAMEKVLPEAHLSVIDADGKKLTDAKIEEIILKGQGKMMPVAGVDDKKAAAITAYVRLLQKGVQPDASPHK